VNVLSLLLGAGVAAEAR